ncbi:MAG: autotransporter outer membrane beta-barrel domain-containing protein [Akkermansia sp.]|nr:autotransporter outer membrane beta-barrel domain-containing protein [Akkermansia sp.]
MMKKINTRILGQLGTAAVVAGTSLMEVYAVEAPLGGHNYATAMSSQLDGNIGHLRRLRSSMGKGTPLQAKPVYAVNTIDSKAGSMTETVLTSPATRWRVGVQGFYEQTSVDGNNRGAGHDRDEAGAQLVAEYLVRDSFLVGGSVSYGRAHAKTDNARTSNEDNTRFDIYSIGKDGRWTCVNSIGMGLNYHNLHGADLDGYAINFMHETAYDLMRSESATLQVYAGVQTSWNKLDGARHRGDNYTLRVRSQDAWATDVNMGFRYNIALPSIGSAPEGLLSLQTGAVGSVGNVNPAAKFTVDGESYRQSCATRDRWGWEIGAGLDIPITENLALFGTAEGIIRSDSYAFDAQLGMKMAF